MSKHIHTVKESLPWGPAFGSNHEIECSSCANGIASSFRCARCCRMVVSSVREGYQECECAVTLCRKCTSCLSCHQINQSHQERIFELREEEIK